ncbi:MAG: helix-turn-helix transcriptional regulator [Coriobacteriales bacterium]|jgi:DNA-binding CsgD family transcriptional regulator|nr:helix-turn-helix transcriptional regulator [Coriobacteriales bacterium]
MRNVARALPLTPLLLTVGLVAAGVWTDVVGYSVNLLPPDDGMTTGFYNRDAFHMGRLCVGILFFVLARHIPPIQKPLAVITGLLMSVATGTLIIAFHQTLVDPLILSFCGVFVASAGYSFLVWNFYMYFARHMQTRAIVWCIAISLVLETVFSILISLYLSPVPQMLIVISAPLLATICYFAGVRLDQGHRAPVEPQSKAVGFEKYSLLTQVAVFTAALIFIRSLSNIGIWGEVRTNFTGMTELSLGELGIICVTILLLTFLTLDLPSKHISLPLCCTIGFAAILGALQILALSSELQLGSGFDAITSAAEIFSHLVRWMIIIECIRAIDMPSFRIAGISNPVSAGLSLLWAHVIEPIGFATSTFVMIVVYVLFLIVLALFIRSLATRQTAPWSSSSPEELDGYARFANRWDLSPRETEIFTLLMLGRKRAEIERECGLSEGTVKTHISNIYKKLDVHSKHEMHLLYAKGLEESLA